MKFGIKEGTLNQHGYNVYLWPKISVLSKPRSFFRSLGSRRLAVTIIDIGKLFSSSDNFVGAAFFKRDLYFMDTKDNDKVEATTISYAGMLMFTVNIAVLEVLANVYSSSIIVE